MPAATHRYLSTVSISAVDFRSQASVHCIGTLFVAVRLSVMSLNQLIA